MELTNRLKERLITEPTDPRFKCIDDGGVEIETGELIYGFVRRLKPTNCLSTGVYTGVSDLFIGQALKDNEVGHLTALEYEQFHIDRARKFWEEMGISQQITSVKTDSTQFKPTRNYQFMFLDTELHLRFHELVNFYSNLDEGGYILIHDMNRTLCQGNVNPDHPDFKHWPVGELPQDFIDLVKEGKLKSFYFGGARGLVGFYKPHPDDFI